jgi:hypothetical protein
VPEQEARTIGEIGARILQRGGHSGRIYYFGGRESLSQYDVARLVAETTGQQLDFISVNPEASAETLVGLGFPQWMAADLIRLNSLTEIDERSSSPDQEEELLEGGDGFADFVRGHLESFREGREQSQVRSK